MNRDYDSLSRENENIHIEYIKCIMTNCIKIKMERRIVIKNSERLDHTLTCIMWPRA